MSKIQFPKCEKCGSRLIPQIEKRRLWCQVCGHIRTDRQALALLDQYTAHGGQEVYTPDYAPTVRVGGPSQEQLALLQDAWHALHQNDRATARYICNHLLESDSRLIDAYYLLFLAAENDEERKHHLMSILAFDPYHEQANFEMAKLRGIIAKDARPSFSTISDHRQTVEAPVEAKAKMEKCPMCGAQTLYVEGDLIKCLACNYSPPTAAYATKPSIVRLSMPKDGGYHSLQEALLIRKYGGGREWIIARRVLACQSCGAQLTLSGGMMTTQCTFCNSQHILFQDALGSFQQPDGVLPAQLDEREAHEVLRGALPIELQNAVARHESVGVFIPYWCFRGEVAIRGLDSDRVLYIENVLVAGSQEPSQQVLADVQPYDLRELRPYDQRYLARWSAGLYTQDAIQASVTANAFVKHAALSLYLGHRFANGLFARTDLNFEIPGYSLQQNTDLIGMLEYRLVLLPIWMTTLHLKNGGWYHSLINAQSGEVVITERIDSKGGYRARKEGTAQPKSSAF